MGNYVLTWLTASLVVWVAAAIELRCDPPLCTDQHFDSDANTYYFKIEGNEIHLSYKDEIYFTLFCGNKEFPSPSAMPQFTRALHVSNIELSGCNLPSSGSIAELLTAMNITLQEDENKQSFLEVKYLSSDQKLLTKQFVGLEHLTDLLISAESELHPIPEANFLSSLQNLREISLFGIPLRTGELNNLPKLHSVGISNTIVKPLHEILQTIPNYWRNLTLRNNEFEIDNDVPKDVKVDSSELENLWLTRWQERRLKPMVRCNSLRLLEISNPSVEVLPERWVAACPQLETLTVYTAENLTSLPQKLLEGATALKYLTFSTGELQSLPDRLFDGAPNLIKVDLWSNRLRTISSTAFLGATSLKFLNLELNQLENEALESLKSVTSLTTLRIADNPTLGNLCDYNGYSPLKDLIQLRDLNLQGLNITYICRDWRENLIYLPRLKLDGTKISEIGFKDFQYKRDASIETVVVSLHGAPITSIKFTKDDYKTTTELESGPAVKIDLSYYDYNLQRGLCALPDKIIPL